MTKEELIRMAREAGTIADIAYIMSCSDDEFERVTGFRLPDCAWERWRDDMNKREEQLLAFFKKAIDAEREACAKVCEARVMGDNNREDEEAKRCAAAIRARGQE